MALRKKFIEVEIPMLGETVEVLGSPESLKGRTIKMDLTRPLKGRALEIVFKIFSDKKPIIAQPKRLELMKSYIIRMIHPSSSYIEDSFSADCKDIPSVIKPFLITRKKVSRAIRNNLRKTCKEFLQAYLKEKNFLEVCYDILNRDLQKAMLPKLKKVYPLSFCEIRVFDTKAIDKANLDIKLQAQEVAQEIEEAEIEEKLEEKPVETAETEKTEEQEEEKKETAEEKSKE